MPKVISIHSYRGGTGKSNFTANLATSVALQGKRVGIVDTDLQSPGIHNIFALDIESNTKNLNYFLWEKSTIEDITHDVTKNVGISGTGKIFLIPASVVADDIAKILQEGYDVAQLHEGFRKFVKTYQLDYLFVDTHPGLSKETLLSIATSHILLLILRPDKQDYQGTAVTVDVARQLQVRNMMIIMNKALNQMDETVLKEKVQELYGVPLTEIFPLSEDVVRLASEGVFCVQNPDHEISKKFIKLAQILMN